MAHRGTLSSVMVQGQRRRKQRPLERSSLEAYGGMLIAVVIAVWPGAPFWITLLLLLVAACLLTHVFFRAPLTIGWNKSWKVVMTLFVWVVAFWVCWLKKPQLSYVYVAPAVWLPDGRWVFIINHRGPEAVSRTEILFQDQDKLENIKATQAGVENVESYEKLLKFPEIDPEGRGSIYTPQFAWKPFSQERSHFTAAITSSTMNYDEDIYIARVADKWYFAMSLKERNSKQIFECSDVGFPHSDSTFIAGKPCFPTWTANPK